MVGDETTGTDLAAVLLPNGATAAGRIAAKVAGPALEAYARKHSVGRTLKQLDRELEGLKRAVEMIEESGLSFAPISAKHMFPTLAGLEVEDDPDLRERWASLIANAATSGDASTAAYADILRQLEPLEARVLSDLYTTAMTAVSELHHVVGVRREAIQSRHDLSAEDFQALADDLMRHRLVAAPRTWGGHESEYSTLTITSLGIHFVRACQAPGSVDPAPTILNREQLKATMERQTEAPPGAVPEEGPYFLEAIESSPPEVDALRRRMDHRDVEQERLERDMKLDELGA